MSTRSLYRDAYIVNDDGELIRFHSCFVFIPKNNWFKLTELRVFQNGMFELEGNLFGINEIESAVHDSKIVTQVPDGRFVSIPDLAGFYVNDFVGSVEEADFLRELQDIQKHLNGEPTTSDLCRRAYEDFKDNPSDANRIALTEAYERVPFHLTCWLLGFDEKDAPIRRAIYGDRMDKE